MRSRRTNRLIGIGGLVVLAAFAGSLTRGAGSGDGAEVGAGPLVTITASPAPEVEAGATATGTATTDASADGTQAAAARVAAAKAAALKAAAAKVEAANAAAAAAAKAKSAAATWTVGRVVDGDTIWVTRDGVSLKIRYIGIDTPEIGQCGYAEATRNLQRLLGGQRVTLTAGARDDVDRYGRLLRYVDVNGVDSGLRQITQGYAVARYDSRDGYGGHTREGPYVRADAASPRAACSATSTGTGSTSTTPLPVKPSTSGWPLAGDEHPCPRSAPIKGNESSMIAHSPGQQSYLVTNPERCFTSLGQAATAGYRPAKR